MADPYDVLGVPPDADEATVRSAYRSLLKTHHPDQGGSVEAFKRIQAAYETILDGCSTRTDGGTTTRSPGTAAPASGARSPSSGKPSHSAAADTVRSDRSSSVPGTVDDRMVASERRSRRGSELVADGPGYEVRLTELIENLDASTLLPDYVEHGWRVAACFRVSTDVGRSFEWATRRVRVLTLDGESYRPSIHRPRKARLPGPWRSDDATVGPDDSIRVFVLSEALPEGATVDRLVYRRGPVVRREQPNIEFEIDDEVRSRLRRPPAGWGDETTLVRR